MLYKKSIYILYLGLFLFSCTAQKRNSEYGTLKGVIGIFEGNCMPSPGSAPCKAQPISTTVFVTSVSANFQKELLIDSVITDNEGSFILNLPAGYYSLFIRDGNEIICDGVNCEKECYCTLFQIQPDSVIEISANINHANW